MSDKLSVEHIENILWNELVVHENGTLDNQSVKYCASRIEATVKSQTGGMRWRSGNDFPLEDGVYPTRINGGKNVINMEFVKDAGGWNTTLSIDGFKWLDESSKQP